MKAPCNGATPRSSAGLPPRVEVGWGHLASPGLIPMITWEVALFLVAWFLGSCTGTALAILIIHAGSILPDPEVPAGTIRRPHLLHFKKEG